MDESGLEENLKPFTDKTWSSVINAASVHSTLKSDKYAEVTQEILLAKDTDRGCGYHTVCYRLYTAVKRPKTTSKKSKKACVNTRFHSVLPKSDKKGLLKGSCIFCGKARKVIKGKNEKRRRVQTGDGSDAINLRAEYSKNDRIKILVRSGVKLIEKEAEYHNSCRLIFNNETAHYLDQGEKEKSCRFYHTKAFSSILSYIKSEVITNSKPVLISDLVNMYKAEYCNSGGNEIDIQEYKSQGLTRKLKSQLGSDINISLFNQHKGNFIHSSTIDENDAKALFYEDAEKYECENKIKWAALHLRSLILKIPQNKTPDPVTVNSLRECCPELPTELDVFFRTLITGTNTTSKNVSREDTVNKKITAMASDTVYNVTQGKVKPWKHITLGLGFASLTGSKLVLQILNRMGYCISYTETKSLETEFAYSVQDDAKNAPNGIELKPNLATACVWDNNDANVETLDGKDTLHATVGHTYQNVLQNEENINAEPLVFKVGQKRRSFVGNKQDVPPFRKCIKKAKFTSSTSLESLDMSENEEPIIESDAIINWLDDIKIKLKPLDFYWFLKLREGNIALYAGFMSSFINDPLPLQRICYMDPIFQSPTNNDVVKETMIRTMNIANEIGQDFAVVTYDLNIAVKAYSIQAIESPLFDKLLIMLGNFHIELAFLEQLVLL